MSANHLFYKAFQVVSKFVYTDRVHNCTFMYGVSVPVYVKRPNKAKAAERVVPQ